MLLAVVLDLLPCGCGLRIGQPIVEGACFEDVEGTNRGAENPLYRIEIGFQSVFQFLYRCLVDLRQEQLPWALSF